MIRGLSKESATTFKTASFSYLVIGISVKQADHVVITRGLQSSPSGPCYRVPSCSDLGEGAQACALQRLTRGRVAAAARRQGAAGFSGSKPVPSRLPLAKRPKEVFACAVR